MINNKPSVLYVDDEVHNLTSFKAAFRKGYDITIVSSPKEALKLLEHSVFNIILADQRMPEISGTDFLTIAEKKAPNSVRMLITAYADINAAIDAINRGKVFKYIPKPYDHKTVVKILKEAAMTHQQKVLASFNARFKEAYLQSHDAIFLMGRAGKITTVNDAFLRLLGYEQSDIYRTPYHSFFSKSVLKQLLALFKTDNIIQNFETEIESKSGKKIDCLLSVKKVQDPDSGDYFYQGVIKDITVHKQKVKSIFETLVSFQGAERENFSFSIHEGIAQRIAGVKLYLSVLKSKREKDETFITILEKADEELDEVISELRDISFELMPRSVSFSKGDELMNGLFKLLQRRGVEFTYTLLDDEELNEKKKSTFYKNLQNLILAITKKTKANEMWIHMDKKNDMIKIEVGYNGLKNLSEASVEAFLAKFTLSDKQYSVATKGEFEVLNIDFPIKNIL